jgi:hypothetical protein
MAASGCIWVAAAALMAYHGLRGGKFVFEFDRGRPNANPDETVV